MFHPHRRREPGDSSDSSRQEEIDPFPSRARRFLHGYLAGQTAPWRTGDMSFLERKNGINQQKYEGFNREIIYKSGFIHGGFSINGRFVWLVIWIIPPGESIKGLCFIFGPLN